MVIILDEINGMEIPDLEFLVTSLKKIPNCIILIVQDSDPGSEKMNFPSFLVHFCQSSDETTLSPLETKESKALVQSMLGTTDVPDSFIEKVVPAAGGNPALIQEVVQNASDSAALIYDEGRWNFDQSKWKYRKGSVRRKMMTRFRKLSSGSKQIIKLLSLSETVNELNIIFDLLDFDAAEFLDCLEELNSGGFIYRKEGQLIFRHQAVQSLIRESIPATLRRSIHDRIAGAIQKKDQYGPGEQAYHLAGGTKPSRALPYFIQENIRLLELARYQESIITAETALEIQSRTKKDKEYFSHLYLNKGIANRALGNLDQAQAAYENSKAISQTLNNRQLLSKAAVGLAGVLWSQGHASVAGENFQIALELAVKIGNASLESQCRLGLGVCWYAEGYNKQALEEAKKAEKICMEKDYPNNMARSLQLMGDIYMVMGQYPESRQCNEKALEIFKNQGQKAQFAAAILNIARTYLDTGHLEKAELQIREAMEIAQEEKQHIVESFSRINLGYLYVAKGEYLRAVRNLERACSDFQKIGFPQPLANSLKMLAVSKEAIGDPEAAEKDFQNSLDLHRSQKDAGGESECLQAMAGIKLKRGSLKEASKLLHGSRKIAYRIKNRIQVSETYYLLSQIYSLTGKTDRAHGLLKISEKLNTDLGRYHHQGRVLCDLGFLKLDSGDVEAAEQYFNQAEKTLEPCGMVPVNLRVLRGLYEISCSKKEIPNQIKIKKKFQKIMKELDDHATIPDLFFRIDPPGFETPTGETGIKLSRILLKSPVYQNTAISLFARTTAAAASRFARAAEDLYQISLNQAVRYGFTAIADQLNLLIHNEPEDKQKGSRKIMRKKTMSDIKPIQQFIRGSRQFFVTSDLNRLLTSVLDQVIDVTSAERGFLMTRNSAGKLRFRISRNIQQNDIVRPEFEISRSIIDHVEKSKKSYMSGDVGEEDLFKQQKSVRELGLRSVLCVPISSEGLIYVDNSLEKGLFTNTEKLLVEIVAEVSSIALENFKNKEKLAATKHALSKENLRLKAELERRYRFGTLVGRCSSMEQIFSILERVADSNASIMISGATGTGKEVVARVIHYNSSRKNNPFISINCAALPENLLEAELFGIEKGVATGVDARMGLIQKADGGTLFLDEIGDMNPATQAKILRVLQEREVVTLGGRKPKKVNIRVISATNKNLKEEMKNKNFREDLYYRLNVIHIELPPLKDRKEDLLPLAMHFLDKYSKEANRDFEGFTPEALRKMGSYEWPGNVRELENAIQRATILETGTKISSASLPHDISGVSIQDEPDEENLFSGDNLDIKLNIEKLETILIRKALNQSGGVKKDAAGLLGVTPRILSYYLKKHHLN